MNRDKKKIRYISQYHFNKGDNASKACRNYVIYDEGAISKSPGCKWFARLYFGNLDTKAEPYSDRPITGKSDETVL